MRYYCCCSCCCCCCCLNHLQSASLPYALPWLMVALWIWTYYSRDWRSQRSLPITGERWSLMIQHLAQLTIETQSKNSLLCKVHLNTLILMHLLIVSENLFFFYLFLFGFCKLSFRKHTDWQHLEEQICHIFDQFIWQIRWWLIKQTKSNVSIELSTWALKGLTHSTSTEYIS